MMQEADMRQRRWRGTVAAAAGATLLAAAAGAAAPRGFHGAAAEEVQLERLETLLPAADLGPPAGFPPDVWEAMVPDDNALTPARVELGRRLFFDRRLSRDGTVSCATCHDVTRGFTDQRPVSEGVDDQLGRRNAPTTMNAVFFQTFFLDGRAPSLEEQAKLPITNPVEMAMPDDATAVAAVADDPAYGRLFADAYGRAPNFDDLARAIAAFERTMVFLSSPFDRFLAGDQKAISPQAREGWVLFNGKARCVSCHAINRSNPIGTDNRFHNIGVSARHQNFEALARKALDVLRGVEGRAGLEAVDRMALETDMSELGHFLVTKNRSDIGAFKTSQLRNVGVTGPYMHDGSLQTLWDVMDHYNKGGEANAFLDGGIEPLALTEAEIDAVVALMFDMTDDRLAADNRRFETQQRARARTTRPFRDDALALRRVLPFERRVLRADEQGR
jgi:cytochrome c peroxidase